MSANPYRDPRAMRNAIADRLRPLARERGVQLSSLQRQFAYDRLLCRVFRDEPGRWVLKGATAMLSPTRSGRPPYARYRFAQSHRRPRRVRAGTTRRRCA